MKRTTCFIEFCHGRAVRRSLVIFGHFESFWKSGFLGKDSTEAKQSRTRAGSNSLEWLGAPFGIASRRAGLQSFWLFHLDFIIPATNLHTPWHPTMTSSTTGNTFHHCDCMILQFSLWQLVHLKHHNFHDRDSVAQVYQQQMLKVGIRDGIELMQDISENPSGQIL